MNIFMTIFSLTVVHTYFLDALCNTSFNTNPGQCGDIIFCELYEPSLLPTIISTPGNGHRYSEKETALFFYCFIGTSDLVVPFSGTKEAMSLVTLIHHQSLY